MYVILLFLLIGPEIILLMGGNKYIEAINVLPPVVVGFVFQFIYSLYVNIEFYHKKQKDIAFATIIAAVINIGLNAFFIPKYGYVAAAYTTLAGYIVLFIIHFYNVHRLGKTSWYDTRFNFLCCTIALLLLFVISLIYRYRMVRIGIFTCILAISGCLFIKYRKYIIQCIRRIISR